MYPSNWLRCHCGDFALDGHLTCGRAVCDEQRARDKDQAQQEDAEDARREWLRRAR